MLYRNLMGIGIVRGVRGGREGENFDFFFQKKNFHIFFSQNMENQKIAPVKPNLVPVPP